MPFLLFSTILLVVVISFEVSSLSTWKQKPKYNNIFILCDGTANGHISYTNIRRLYDILNASAVNSDVVKNHISYIEGIGLGEGVLFPNVGNLLLANDIYSKVNKAYAIICKSFANDSDVENRIWMFGFSRGAYIARVLSEIIYRCGVIKRELTHPDVFDALSQQAYKIFVQDEFSCKDEAMLFYESFSVRNSRKKSVFFLGLWDTVGAVGIPKYRPGYGFEYSSLLKYQRVPPPVRHVYHAIATHECLMPFEVMHAIPSHPSNEFGSSPHSHPAPQITNQIVEEKWFPGYHLDIGGFCGDQPIPNATLNWMLDRMRVVPREERGFDFIFPPNRLDRWQKLINRVYFVITAICTRIFIRGLFRFHFVRDRFIPGVDATVLYNGGDWRFARRRYHIWSYPSKTYKVFRDILVATKSKFVPPSDPFF
eukprot:gene24132-31359_t